MILRSHHEKDPIEAALDLVHEYEVHQARLLTYDERIRALEERVFALEHPEVYARLKDAGLI